MTIFEFEKEAWQKLKGMPLRAKIEHIATYYWIPIVSVIVAASLIGFSIYNTVTRTETMLLGYCINTSAKEFSQTLKEDFSAHAELTEKQEIVLLTNLNINTSTGFNDTMQALTVRAAAEEVDFIASDMEGSRTMVQYGYFSDLTKIFTAEQLEQLEPRILYAERSEIIYDESNYSQTDEMPPLPKLAKAASFTDPVPVALDLGADTLLTDAYKFIDGKAVMLIMPNSQRLEMLQVFLDYIME